MCNDLVVARGTMENQALNETKSSLCKFFDKNGAHFRNQFIVDFKEADASMMNDLSCVCGHTFKGIVNNNNVHRHMMMNNHIDSFIAKTLESNSFQWQRKTRW